MREFSTSTLASDFHFLEDVLQQSERGKRLIQDLGLKHGGSGGGGGANAGANAGANKRKRMNVGDAEEEQEAPIHPLSKLRLSLLSVEDDKSVGNAETGTPTPNVIEPLIQVSEETSTCTGTPQNQSTKPISKLTIIDKDPSLLQYSKAKQRLVQMAMDRKTRLLLMPPMMQRHINNTSTRFDIKKNMIYWKVEFIFHILSDNADHDNSSQVQAVLVLDRIPEDESLYKHFVKEFEKQLMHSAGSETRSILGHFREKTVAATATVATAASTAITASATTITATDSATAVKVTECQLKKNAVTLMKRIPCQSSHPKYHKLDLHQCLRDMLSGLAIIEFPTIEVVLKGDAKLFPLLIEEVE